MFHFISFFCSLEDEKQEEGRRKEVIFFSILIIPSDALTITAALMIKAERKRKNPLGTI